MNFNNSTENNQELSRQRTFSEENHNYFNSQVDQDSASKEYSPHGSNNISKQSSAEAPSLLKKNTTYNSIASHCSAEEILGYNPSYSIGITSEDNYQEEYPFQDTSAQNKTFLNVDDYFREHDALTLYNNTEPKILPKSFEQYAQFEGDDGSHTVKRTIDKAFSADNTKQKRTPRPPNAFIIYRKETQANVIKANPGVSNKEISVIIGKMWKQEPQSVKDQYKVKAENEKQIHKKMFPDYKYQPRKSKKIAKADSATPFSSKNIFSSNSKNKLLLNAVNSGYPASNQAVYDIQNLPQSNIMYSNNSDHVNIKKFMSFENNKNLKPYPFSNQSIASQYVQPVSALPSNYNYNNTNSNIVGGYGLPITDVNAFQHRTLLSPASNRSIPNMSIYNQMDNDLNLKRISSNSDAFINPMFSKQMDKLSRIYNDSENIVNFNLQNLANNPTSKFFGSQPMYGNTTCNNNNTNTKLDLFEKNNTFSRMTDSNTFNLNSSLGNKLDGFTFFKNGGNSFSNDPVYSQKEYDILEDVDFSRNSEQKMHYQQNSGFSIPLVTDIHGNEL
ncbi:hypothetical protein BB561_002965 [Smittium simulii]|uniref:HMG box domain-containing protein n=1 Tax=Smittium simulii TaxID=133385 RepID=A0A2T9YNM5_9FUNG|nr:hypothetical protein BB561_002965 [Smittium simulii]